MTVPPRGWGGTVVPEGAGVDIGGGGGVRKESSCNPAPLLLYVHMVAKVAAARCSEGTLAGELDTRGRGREEGRGGKGSPGDVHTHVRRRAAHRQAYRHTPTHTHTGTQTFSRKIVFLKLAICA